MKKRLITYADRDLWNDFVAASRSSPILQSFEWGELKSLFSWEPLRIAVEDNGKLVAGVSILKKKIPYIGYSVFYAPRGPLVSLANREQVEFLLSAIEEEADAYKAISLKIDPEVPDVSADQSPALETLKTLGFVRSAKQVQPRATFLLDLTRDSADILKSFEEKTRYNVRLAIKKDVTIKEDASEKGVNLFFNIYQETAGRDKFMIHPLKYYQSIRELLFKKNMGSCFIAYYNERAVGAVIVFCFGSRVWYMYGASRSEHRNVMPNHLLHWYIIQWAKAKGYKIYDLWGIPVDPRPEHPLYGVYRFKKGFNGKQVRFIGAYDFPYSPLFYNLFEFGATWWKNINSLIKKGKISDSLSE
ncbi:MAG: peptidoglycan bridge formation glycyltransferase FemA/FemB family protein [Candidatus Saganbacteria bacterium]|nr:peptidoglycan bridge formation glycyltransferase FemA/FemB family protein [Candidatus Saganbacteria bacterium]